MAEMTEAEKKAAEEAEATAKAAKEQAEKEKAAEAAKKKKQKVKLSKQVKFNGEIYRAGTKIDVTKEEAAELRAAKALVEEDED